MGRVRIPIDPHGVRYHVEKHFSSVGHGLRRRDVGRRRGRQRPLRAVSRTRQGRRDRHPRDHPRHQSGPPHERDTLTFKAVDRVTGFDSLKPGQRVDMRYYRVTDYLVAKTTPEMTEMARAILSDPARAPGLPGTEMRARLWSLSGMVVRTDMEAKKVEIVDPNSGEIIRSPWIKTPEGQAELEKFKPGDMVTMVFSERSAFEITPVR